MSHRGSGLGNRLHSDCLLLDLIEHSFNIFNQQKQHQREKRGGDIVEKSADVMKIVAHSLKEKSACYVEKFEVSSLTSRAPRMLMPVSMVT